MIAGAHAGHWLESVAMVAPLLVLPAVLYGLVLLERSRSSTGDQR